MTFDLTPTLSSKREGFKALLHSKLFPDNDRVPSYPWTVTPIDGDVLASRALEEIHKLFTEDWQHS